MDHHCPWVFNWIGFRNKKFFKLWIIYQFLFGWLSSIVLWFDFITACILEFNLISEKVRLDEIKGHGMTYALCSQIWFLVILFFTYIIGNFLKYHIDLALQNKTTIEDLENRTNNTKRNRFDIGYLKNIKSVFGKNWIFWALPTTWGPAEIEGDGVNWLKNTTYPSFTEYDYVSFTFYFKNMLNKTQ
jgi:hypothetical protein